MSGPPSVSVVVAVRNAEKEVGECLRSLRALDYPPGQFELVVVDNASTDGTARVLAGFGDELSVVQERRRGPAAARNAGIRASGGEVIALVDADCTVDPGWLSALVPALDRTGVGIAGGKILAVRPATAIELFGESIHDAQKAVLVWNPPYVITMNWAARRQVLDELGLFDETLLRCSDVDFSWRAVQAGYEFAYCDEAVVYHRNERTLAGLFREGWTHGFHAVRLRRRYARLIAEQVPSGTDDPPPPAGTPARVFRGGKRVGGAMGTVWWSLR